MVIVIHQASSTANAFFIMSEKLKKAKPLFIMPETPRQKIRLFTLANTGIRFLNE